MIVPFAEFLERRFGLSSERTIPILTKGIILLAVGSFLLLATLLVAFDSVFPGRFDLAMLREGDVVTRNIYAPETRTIISHVLTERMRQDARENTPPVYNPADRNIASTQNVLAARILDFIDNVRRDTFATPEQRIADLQHISALELSPETLTQIVQFSDEAWNTVKTEIIRLLGQVMQEAIRDTDLPAILNRLPNQVDWRFTESRDTAVVVDFVQDLIRPNLTIDPNATAAARESAAQSIPDQEINFQRGQLIVASGAILRLEDLETLQQLGLLQPLERRWQEIGRAFVAVIVVMVVAGLYISRFRPKLLYGEPRFLALLAAIFLIVLAGARLSMGGQMYLYPTALLALLYVSIINQQIAVIGVIGLAFLIGLMAGNSLEWTVLVGAGGLIGAMSLKRAERVNSYFVAGLMISLVNLAVVAIFHLTDPVETVATDIPPLLIYALLNGVLAAAAAIVGLYLIGQIFNLPTALKLIELSQPNQPLLQRLLREAPGTYQHSLQVGNLSEQAANAIGANAALVYVAALYHDIGKMLNPAFFTENQRDANTNLHDTLNDPYRSADIIISHVTDGDDLARQHRLPARIRDFIREHHGTTEVYVFYQQALARAGEDKNAVDIRDFTYPGPRPQSRETAVMMLADSAEATIRSVQPGTRQEIEQLIENIIEGKRKSGQLDDSGLTLNDLNTIKRTFVDILKGMFHPRINYTEAVSRAHGGTTSAGAATTQMSVPVVPPSAATRDHPRVSDTPKTTPKVDAAKTQDERPPRPDYIVTKSKALTQDLPRLTDEDDDDSPLPDVPPLPRANNGKNRQTSESLPEQENRAVPKDENADEH